VLASNGTKSEPFVIAMDALNPQKRSRSCALSTRFPAFSSLCGEEISVFTLCRDSDVDGAWQEGGARFDSAEIRSL